MIVYQGFDPALWDAILLSMLRDHIQGLIQQAHWNELPFCKNNRVYMTDLTFRQNPYLLMNMPLGMSLSKSDFMMVPTMAKSCYDIGLTLRKESPAGALYEIETLQRTSTWH